LTASTARRFFPLAAAFYLALAVAGIVGLGAQRGALGVAIWIDPGSWWTDVAVGFGLAVLLLGLWAAMVRFAPGARRVEAELRSRLGPIRRSEAVALAVVSALAEEVAFRGALQTWLGWLPAAVLFALAHFAPPRHFRWWTLWALAGGLALGWVTLERGTLAAAIVAHITVNSWQLVRFALHARRERRGAVVSATAAPVPTAPAGAPTEPTPEPATDEVPEEVLVEISREAGASDAAAEVAPPPASGEPEATAPADEGPHAPRPHEEEWR
jgi:membrane protease YdiL (CAAX protease family)